MRFMVKTFWTVWALGWWRVTSFQGKTLELKLFFGPFVFTWWK